MNDLTRRNLVLGLAASGLAAPALGQTTGAAAMANSTEMEADPSQSIRRNISALQARSWQDHFPSLQKGAILCDTKACALHFWAEDGITTRLYPTSVPVSDELTRLGSTVIVRKAEFPTWRPTPSMRANNPDWPEVVPGGDPLNPLGARGMYLDWQFYLLHGTHDTRKIGRRSSNGCIGLYNEHVVQLYDLAQIGTQVVLI